jgi:hypothetical protein
MIQLTMLGSVPALRAYCAPVSVTRSFGALAPTAG